MTIFAKVQLLQRKKMANFSKQEIKDIISRIKSESNLKTDADLSLALGLAETTINTWKRRGTLDLALLIDKLGNLDLDYIIYGERTELNSKSNYKTEHNNEISIPLYTSRVSAGKPLQVTEDIEAYIYPTKRYHRGTFMVGVQGDSMQDAGILDGDKLLVDTLREPKTENIVIARLDGEMTVKRLSIHKGSLVLAPENPKYKVIEVNSETEIIGVVVSVQRDYV